MNIFKTILALGLVTFLSGCYINVISPKGGSIAYGVETCAAETVCKYSGDITGGFYYFWNELFVATPIEGYRLVGWEFQMRVAGNPNAQPVAISCDIPISTDPEGSCRLNFSRWPLTSGGYVDAIGIEEVFQDSYSQGYLMPIYDTLPAPIVVSPTPRVAPVTGGPGPVTPIAG